MWATPAHVDLRALCDAHRVPFTSVTQLPELLPTLRAAWGRRAATVVEVVTDRHSNVAVHRQIQAACTSAARRAVNCLPPLPPLPAISHSVRPSTQPTVSALRPAVAQVSIAEYSLPLVAPLTTEDSGRNSRHGFLLQVTLAPHAGPHGPLDSVPIVSGLGDIAPLPGLHRESYADALAQAATLAELLPGCSVPVELAMLDGGLDAWWRGTVGVLPATLLPSVRFAVECALMEALAAGAHPASPPHTFAAHLAACALAAEPTRAMSRRKQAAVQAQASDTSAQKAPAVAEQVTLNALLDPGALDAQALQAKARALVAEGYTTIKVKVSTRQRWVIELLGSCCVQPHLIWCSQSKCQIKSSAMMLPNHACIACGCLCLDSQAK